MLLEGKVFIASLGNEREMKQQTAHNEGATSGCFESKVDGIWKEICRGPTANVANQTDQE